MHRLSLCMRSRIVFFYKWPSAEHSVLTNLLSLDITTKVFCQLTALSHLKLWIEGSVAWQHVLNICNGGGHSVPNDVFSLICEIHGEVESISIIYDVCSGWWNQTFSFHILFTMFVVLISNSPCKSKNIINVACSVSCIKFLLKQKKCFFKHYPEEYCGTQVLSDCRNTSIVIFWS